MASNSTTRELGSFFDDLVRCETRLYNALNDRLRSKHGIVATQFEFLRYLDGHPSSRVADVAANFAAGIGAISKGVDRLETRGWVARQPNPADGRSSLVSLTSTGAALLAEAEVSFQELLVELLLVDLTPTQVQEVGAALGMLRAALERVHVGIPVG
ncbi:MarR family winged helix-turn-helix transcriptional regulator [Rathayibacter soli]|uniref:MarR family winged helix-turn-helix transcriptional regulator n=1 Tax=Rathayibacter soli TaxID=3144168 RepID=UPI0027E3DC33|nr:MarR family transcriptional regulator [Glaciibacter superstes]